MPNEIYISKCVSLIESLTELDKLLKQYVSMINIDSLDTIVEYIDKRLNKFDANQVVLENNDFDEIEYNYFKSMRRIISSRTHRSVCYIYEINAIYIYIYITFFKIHSLENELDIYTSNFKGDLEYLEWVVFFKKDIMQQLAELFINNRFEYAYSLDTIIRGIRVLEEHIMFFLLVMECPRKMWDPHLITKLYDHRRNLSRLELFKDKDNANIRIIHDNTPKNVNDYIIDLEEQISDFNIFYKIEMKKLRKKAEQKLKHDVKFNKKDITRLQKILKEKQAQIRRTNLYDFIVLEKDIRHPNTVSKKEFLDDLEKRFKFLTYEFKTANDMYKHINNIFIANGIVYSDEVRTINGFHEYMKNYSTTKMITKLESDIELNLSSHIIPDGMMFNEISLVMNKTEPIKSFINSLEQNIVGYYALLIKAYYSREEANKIIKKINEG